MSVSFASFGAASFFVGQKLINVLMSSARVHFVGANEFRRRVTIVVTLPLIVVYETSLSGELYHIFKIH